MAALFLPLSVDYADDPALEAAGERAELLLIRAHCAMKAKETDGHLSHVQLRKLGLPGAKARADRLVSVGLWERTATGYYDPRFLDDNPSAAELGALRTNKQRGGVLGNHIRWHRDGKIDPECVYCSTDRTSDHSTDRKTIAKGEGREREPEPEGNAEPTGREPESPARPRGDASSSSSSPPPSPDLTRGYALLSEYRGELSDKQARILDDWTSERGSEDWLAGIATLAPDDFYATASEMHRRWRKQRRAQRPTDLSSTGAGSTASAAANGRPSVPVGEAMRKAREQINPAILGKSR